jgi:membrane-associated progesterone receptor component
MSSLKPEDAVSDYSSLDEKELKVLDDWVSTDILLEMVISSHLALRQLSYYTKRYNIVGKLVK